MKFGENAFADLLFALIGVREVVYYIQVFVFSTIQHRGKSIMAWESSLVIGGGVTSTGLVAGGSAVAAAQYGVITLSGADAILNNGVISSAGSVIISSGGSVGGAVVHNGGSIFFSANASASDITVSSGGNDRR